MRRPRKAIAETGLTAHERRILVYLDQRGATHRSQLAQDLADPDSRTATRQNGSNGAVPLIVGRWCSRLLAEGLVKVNRGGTSRKMAAGFYDSHEITREGRKLIRTAPADA